MIGKKGTLALMGSGELTSTMVEVHKELLADVGGTPKAVFLDTPAGFQLNVDQISQKAIDYFSRHIQQHLSIASFKSTEITTPYEAQQAYRMLRGANYVLIGPGSPSYAVRQWRQTPISEILIDQIESGGCLVAASAAALTVGRFTLPVYEIYKVGEDLHWVDGMDILGHFDFNLVVVPHWNNAEGGTHDTRFCYMGGPRFNKLIALLPEDVGILGLDEHTACLINYETDEAEIKGIGKVTLYFHGKKMIFEKGQRFPIDLLRGVGIEKELGSTAKQPPHAAEIPKDKNEAFWDHVHGIETAFRKGLEKHNPRETTNALLELDRTIWQAQQNLESEEFVSQARDTLRELIVTLGLKLESAPMDAQDCIAPVVKELLKFRDELRQQKRWAEADAIRDGLLKANILIEDTKDGSRWQSKPQ